jgi:excisionase family DNA binding protein
MAGNSPTPSQLENDLSDLSTTLPLGRKKRITIEEIASRLSIGRLAVYALLDRGEIPAIRLGRRWIVTRHAYEEWERTCGTKT